MKSNQRNPLFFALGALTLSSLLVLTPTALHAARQQADPVALLRQAGALEAAGKWQAAAQAYDLAAKAFQAQGKSKETAQAYSKSALMYENYANELLKGTTAPAPAPKTPTPQQAPAPAPIAPTAPAAQAGTAPLPLETSAIVTKTKTGTLAVAAKNGTPINGIKLSRHDADIHNPSIVVTPDGTIHVAFVERMAQSPFTYSVYHRSSSDGGRSWSAAKNLSEVMPDVAVGNCKIATDGAGRVYVVWRTGFAPNKGGAEADLHSSGDSNNLVFRVLEGGAWSGKAVCINTPVDPEKQNCGTSSWFVSTDPTGKVHVIWNTTPDPRHPEALTGNSSKYHSPGIALGSIMESVLESKTASAPREIYQAPITEDPESHWPRCDNFDVLNGYVDAQGQAHILANAIKVRIGTEPTIHFELIENGRQTPAVDLPGSYGDYWRFYPTLLVDAQGKRHVVTMYPRGEQPAIRDYVIGSDAEPTIIRATKEVKGKLEGFQAYQGPGGRMIAILQMNDTGKDTDDELYLTTSNGGAWSKPVNITNNTGRLQFHSTQTTSRSHVATESYWYPGPAAATFDKSGHLALVYVSKKFTIVDSSAFGVTIAGGSTSTPNLLFLRF